VRWLPVLRQVPVVRAFAGLRVMPQDGLPILGPVPGRPGLSVAVMHSGYTLAPIVGHLASEWVRGERPSLDLTPYRMDRFAAPG
jgi:glycine/D-amino acid oxidase-like deaminating enzyme